METEPLQIVLLLLLFEALLDDRVYVHVKSALQ